MQSKKPKPRREHSREFLGPNLTQDTNTETTIEETLVEASAPYEEQMAAVPTMLGTATMDGSQFHKPLMRHHQPKIA